MMGHDPDDYYWRMHDVPWGMWVFMTVLVLLLAALLVVAVFMLVRGPGGFASGRPTGASGAGDAARILDERFARGDIDEEEYRRRRTLLDGG